MQRAMSAKAIVPLESDEQTALFEWAWIMREWLPELRLLYHVPNGGLRNKAVGKKLKAEGVRSGVPDICLPVARNGFHGLYIELKRRTGGRVSPVQWQWLELLREQGYAAVVCCGFDEARIAIERYLS